MKLTFILTLLFSFAHAQTYEEYLRSQQEAFSSYKEERDKEFSQFLKKEWKEYKEVQGIKSYESKKPNVLPKAKNQKIQKVKKKVLVTKKDIEIKEPEAYKQIIIKPKKQKQQNIYINFFGVELKVNYDKSILFSINSKISKDAISKSWEKLARSDYESILNDLNLISKKLRLNDWAKYLLVKQVSHVIYKDKNEANIFTWFIFLKMGYDTHIAYQPERVIVLMPVKGELYSTIYFKINGEKYYAIDYYGKGKLGPVMTYENRYKGASLKMDFFLNELPLLAEKSVQKKFIFTLDGKNQFVDLSYNENLMNFFKSYPQVDYSVYFSSPESALLYKSLKKSLEPLVVGKSQSEAVNIILNFVQHAFSYKVDIEQFNKEKVMFPSETLYYPYSDCEDRAILFTYMLKSLLDVDMLGVKYPNHMATAVYTKENIQGDYIKYENKKYMIADPSYINANIGLAMLRFKGKKSYEIIPVK